MRERLEYPRLASAQPVAPHEPAHVRRTHPPPLPDDAWSPTGTSLRDGPLLAVDARTPSLETTWDMSLRISRFGPIGFLDRPGPSSGGGIPRRSRLASPGWRQSLPPRVRSKTLRAPGEHTGAAPVGPDRLPGPRPPRTVSRMVENVPPADRGRQSAESGMHALEHRRALRRSSGAQNAPASCLAATVTADGAVMRLGLGCVSMGKCRSPAGRRRHPAGEGGDRPRRDRLRYR